MHGIVHSHVVEERILTSMDFIMDAAAASDMPVLDWRPKADARPCAKSFTELVLGRRPAQPALTEAPALRGPKSSCPVPGAVWNASSWALFCSASASSGRRAPADLKKT